MIQSEELANKKLSLLNLRYSIPILVESIKETIVCVIDLYLYINLPLNAWLIIISLFGFIITSIILGVHFISQKIYPSHSDIIGMFIDITIMLGIIRLIVFHHHMLVSRQKIVKDKNE